MQLNKKMLEAIQLMVYTDMKKGEIANEVGVEMHRGFKDLALKARKKLDKLIDSNNDGVALGACKEVLSKAGYDATQKIEQKVDTTIRVDVIE